VDCYDALTSDRPYRSKLTDSEAIEILMERRGVMYDPMVVDRFIEAKDELSMALTESLELPNNLEGLLRSSDEGRSGIARGTLPTSVPLDDDRLELHRAARIVLASINREIASVLSIVFLKDTSRDVLYVVDALGMQAGSVAGLRVALGSKVTGWVAANGTGIVNTDARLELPASVGLARETLCTALPIRTGSETIGVLLVARSQANPFDSLDVAQLEKACLRFNESPLRELIADSDYGLDPREQKRPSVH